MRASELHDTAESLEMAVRSWNRSVALGRVKRVPRIFKHCTLDLSLVTAVPIHGNLDIVPRYVNAGFKLFPRMISFNEYFINTDVNYAADRLQNIINTVLGINITDVRAWHQQYHPQYASEQLKDYITAEITPWLLFITYHHDSNQQQERRFRWLRSNAGRTITDQQRDFLTLRPQE